MDEPFELSFTENFPYHSIGFRPDSCAYVFSRLPKNKQRQVILIILVYSLSTIFLSSANQMLYMRYFSYIEISLSKHQSVSEWVCLSVWMFPNSSETANPSELKFLGMIPLGPGLGRFYAKNIWIRRTVSWKIACILAPHSTLAVNSIPSSMNL